MQLPYTDRTEAGRVLADAVSRTYSYQDDAVVLALPRGGVPVAVEVARAIRAPVDLLIVRKLGVPDRPELAMGAIASGGTRQLNPGVVLAAGVSSFALEEVSARESRELHRREVAYRGGRPQPSLRGRWVYLVDDGLATGATMRVAAMAVRQQSPRWVAIAVPVAPAETVFSLTDIADDIVCPAMPDPFGAIGQWYRDFRQCSDEEVRGALAEVWREPAAAAAGASS